jgi:uridine kinase
VRELLLQIAERIPDGARVAIDGVDGVGKTTFADALAAVMDRETIRVSLDDFHHVRAIRFQRGGTAEGFWLDAFDFERFRREVLEPLGPGGSRRYRSRGHDLKTDQVLDPPWEIAPPGAVLIVDGLFLHRDELYQHWDFSVFLDAPFALTVAQMADRDGTFPDPAHPSNQRYVGAQLLYFAACAPRDRATVVIDNSDYDAPRLRS